MLPNVRLIACTDLMFNYAYKDQNSERYKNIVDFASPKTKALDRALLRKFLADSEGSLAALGQVVLFEMGNLLKNLNITPVVTEHPTTDGIIELYTRALNEDRDIVVLGGRRTYHEWIMSGLVDEFVIHQIKQFPSFPAFEGKKVEPHTGYFEDLAILKTVGNFAESRLLVGGNYHE